MFDPSTALDWPRPPASDLSDGLQATLRRAQEITRDVPDAILCGEAAARLTFWPALPEPEVFVVSSPRRLKPRPGVEFVRRKIGPGLRRGLPGCVVTSRALTAIDLVDTHGGDAIDEALRSGARLSQLWDAYAALPRRHGNRLRRQLLEESCGRPWSPAERAAHRALHAAGIEGWTGNLTVPLGDSYSVLDLAFAVLRLDVEIDGFTHHSSFLRFVRDRDRDTQLAAHGWQVVRFSATFVLNNPEAFVERIRAILRSRAKLLGLADPAPVPDWLRFVA